MKYNLTQIMKRAWQTFKKNAGKLSFAECLHRSWLSAKAEPVNAHRIAEAKAAAGITEDTDTWAGWKAKGFEVIHESKALFGCTLIWGSRGDGAEYKAHFFGASQVRVCA